MRCRISLVVLVLGGWASLAIAQERQALSLATAQPLSPPVINATGRVQPLVSIRVSARVSGYIAELGKDEGGRPLDAGMSVKAGQVLFQIDQATFRNTVAILEAGMASAKANLDNLTAKTREERLEQLRQAVAELDARIADTEREEERYKRLVEQEKTLPARRLEEVQTQLRAQRAVRRAAEARLREAENGPTPTEIAVAAARVKEAEAALKVAQDDLRDTTVKAPFDGLITRRFKSPGDYLVSTPPTEVLELVATDKLEAELRLPEAYLPAVQAGQTAVAIRSPLLKEAMRLTITRVVPDIDPAKGTFPVRVAIPSGGQGGLVPGAFVSADVSLGGEGLGVIVPQRAVLQGGGQAAVFVVEEGKMVRRAVELGDRFTEGVVVKSGLKAGQKVVVGAAETLKDGEALPQELAETK